jgi:hypothetical protein
MLTEEAIPGQYSDGGQHDDRQVGQENARGSTATPTGDRDQADREYHAANETTSIQVEGVKPPGVN